MKLLITEKPSQVRDIAAAMGYSRCPEGARGPGIVCTPAIGHILTFEEPNEVMPNASWSDPSTLIPVPREIGLKPSTEGKKFVSTIQKLAKDASVIILATDPDREGEGIGREILDYIKWKGPVQRLWLVGGMDPASIKKAMAKLRDGSETIGFYRAQQARATADWQYTLITRAMTAAGRHGCFGPNLGTGGGRESVVSVGRVQTPTLSLVVKRDMTIENFKPTDHFKPWIDVLQNGESVRLPYDPAYAETLFEENIPGITWIEPDKPNAKPRPLFTDAAQLQAFVDRVSEFDTVQLITKTESMSKAPPKPYSLGTLQQRMNRDHKMTAARTLEAAQALYTGGHLSYPRTEREAYPKDLFEADAQDVIKSISSVPTLNKAATSVAFDKLPGCYTTKPMEHFALMPTRKVPNLSALTDDQRNVWTAVAKRYIENHLPDATGVKITIGVKIPVKGLIQDNPSIFKTTGSKIENPGWMAAFEGVPSGDIPKMTSGSADLEDVGADSSKTKPPARYTEASLLADMKACGKFVSDKDLASTLKEVTGIGTPATRDSIIETLIVRNYMKREKGGQLISTNAGRDLIRQAPKGLAEVEMTARWEQQLSELEDQPDATAVPGRDQFILNQSENADRIIQSCIDAMAKTTARPREPGSGSTNPPTKPMLALAKKIADSKGIPLPKGATKSFDITRAFIDQNIGPKTPDGGNKSSNGPTEKMLAYAKKISASKAVPLPTDVETDFSACRAWLDKHAKA